MAIEFTRGRHHVKHWAPLLTEQPGRVWTQQLIPKLPALTLLRLSGPSPTHFSTAGQMLIWQKRYTGDAPFRIAWKIVAYCPENSGVSPVSSRRPPVPGSTG